MLSPREDGAFKRGPLSDSSVSRLINVFVKVIQHGVNKAPLCSVLVGKDFQCDYGQLQVCHTRRDIHSELHHAPVPQCVVRSSQWSFQIHAWVPMAFFFAPVDVVCIHAVPARAFCIFSRRGSEDWHRRELISLALPH